MFASQVSQVSTVWFQIFAIENKGIATVIKSVDWESEKNLCLTHLQQHSVAYGYKLYNKQYKRTWNKRRHDYKFFLDIFLRIDQSVGVWVKQFRVQDFSLQ